MTSTALLHAKHIFILRFTSRCLSIRHGFMIEFPIEQIQVHGMVLIHFGYMDLQHSLPSWLYLN
jgi:hypothetical protein